MRNPRRVGQVERAKRARPANRLGKSPLRFVKLHAADDADDGLVGADHFPTESA